MASKLWCVSCICLSWLNQQSTCAPQSLRPYIMAGFVSLLQFETSYIRQFSVSANNHGACITNPYYKADSACNKPNVQPRSPWFSSLAFKFIEIDTNINPVAPTSETGTYKLRNQWAGNALFAFYRVNKIQRRTTIQNQRGIKWEMTKISKQQNNDQGMKSYAW